MRTSDDLDFLLATTRDRQVEVNTANPLFSSQFRDR